MRSVYTQPNAAAVHAQFDRVLEQLPERFPAPAEMLEAAAPDILTFTGLPFEQGRQIRSNNPRSGSTRRSGRYTDVVGILLKLGESEPQEP